MTRRGEAAPVRPHPAGVPPSALHRCVDRVGVGATRTESGSPRSGSARQLPGCRIRRLEAARSGSGIAICSPRAFTCGSAKSCSMSLIGPQGTPALSSAASQSALERALSKSPSMGIKTPRFSTRLGLVAKRSSSASSRRSATSQKRANWPSFPTARMMYPSEVWKAS